MGRRIRAHDWAATPLGAPESWPSPLGFALDVCLNSSLPTAIYWGPELRLLYNDAWAPISHDRHPGALGRPAREVWSDIWSIIEPQLARVLATGEGFSTFDQMLPMERGGHIEETYWNYSFTPIRDEHGAVLGVLNQGHETTAKVLAGRKHQAEVERMRELFQQAPGAVALLRGPLHVFEAANPAYLELIGHRHVLDKPVAEALPEVIAQGFVARLDRVYRTGVAEVGRSVPITLRRARDGSTETRLLDFVYQPIRDAGSEVTGIFVQATDITERAHAEAALRMSQARFRQLAEAMPQIVWMATADGGVVYYNRRSLEVSGIVRGDDDLWTWSDAVHPDDRARTVAAWEKALRTGTPYEVQHRLKLADGRYAWHVSRAVPERNADDEIQLWYGTATNIDDVVKAHEAMREADRRKDEFLAMLAHELRNPLAPIRNATQLAKMPNATAAQTAWSVDVIERQVRHMGRLLDDLLEASRISHGTLELRRQRMDLYDALATAAETVRPLLQAKRHELVIDAASGRYWLDADPVRLAQIFTNLLTNAAKYTNPGGHIRIAVEQAEESAVVSVSDDGLGISDEMLPTIFDMFTQASSALERTEGGLGIGLALVRGLVALHGGSVTARSDGPGRGSTFEVRLPLAAAPRQSAATDRPSEPAVTKRRRILVADDNVDAAESLGLLLELKGHDVTLVHDGKSTLEAAIAAMPDVAFVDIGMPKLSGYDVATAIRALATGRSALLVAITGWGQEEDKRRALEAGFDAHLTKPVDPAVLDELIDGGRSARA